MTKIKDMATAFYNVLPVPDYTDQKKWMEYCETLAEIALDMVGTAEAQRPSQLNAPTETCEANHQPPKIINEVVRKLEYAASQCELWEDTPEDASTSAIEFRGLAYRIERFINNLQSDKNNLIKQFCELRDYCDYNCKTFPHKTAENFAYWDVWDKINQFIAENPQKTHLF